MGAGPLGALFSGFMVELFGAQVALVTSSFLMFVVILLVRIFSNLWTLEGHSVQQA